MAKLANKREATFADECRADVERLTARVEALEIKIEQRAFYQAR